MACIGLLVPILPALLDAPPLPRSLYLVQVPLACAVFTSLRLRFFSGHPIRAIVKECCVALLLSLGILGCVMGVFAGVGSLDLIRHSYAGTWGTLFFIGMAGPEYLGMRVGLWAWRRWDRLRRRRYVWALTHAILIVAGGIGLLLLTGAILQTAGNWGNDIWGIPPESFFSRAVFWLSLFILLAFILFASGILLLLPPATLFSYLVARKMTARLENLAKATLALRKGELTTRVEVQGEDEIAQLQADFNAMAADLGETMLALQAEKDKVWKLLEARRELVAGISHELRNPVATIQGYSDSLRRDWQDHSTEEVRHDLETIQYEASRMHAILNDLLAASQVESGHLSISLQAVDANLLAQRLVETFAGLAWGSKRVQVTLSAPSQQVFVLADPLRLEQALVNLVQNAIRHTSPGGLVALDIHPDAEQVCVEVEDTGEGISPDDLPHIWQKYYQAASSQQHTQYGTGLGLSLVKELTEAMGGTVSVESWPGQGSLFQIRLPACEAG